MKLRTRILGVLWLLIGAWLTVNSIAGLDQGDQSLLLAVVATLAIGILVFIIPGIVFIYWQKPGWYLITLIDGGLFAYSLCYIFGGLRESRSDPVLYEFHWNSPETVAAIFSGAYLLVLLTDSPGRWRLRRDS